MTFTTETQTFYFHKQKIILSNYELPDIASHTAWETVLYLAFKWHK